MAVEPDQIVQHEDLPPPDIEGDRRSSASEIPLTPAGELYEILHGVAVWAGKEPVAVLDPNTPKYHVYESTDTNGTPVRFRAWRQGIAFSFSEDRDSADITAMSAQVADDFATFERQHAYIAHRNTTTQEVRRFGWRISDSGERSDMSGGLDEDRELLNRGHELLGWLQRARYIKSASLAQAPHREPRKF